MILIPGALTGRLFFSESMMRPSSSACVMLEFAFEESRAEESTTAPPRITAAEETEIAFTAPYSSASQLLVTIYGNVLSTK